MIKGFNEYITEAKTEAFFVFGRFNPPTNGHEKLFDKLKSAAGSNTYRVYASKSNDPKKNPLQFKDKIKFLRKMFPKHARNIMADADVRTALDIVVKLYDQGFTSVTMIAGSDRVTEFETLLNKYNGEKNRHGFYQFENGIKVVSAGERDADADDVSGMSASKMRAAASDNDLDTFSKGMPNGYKGAKDLFNAIRKGMGLKEARMHRKHVELETVSEDREKFVEGNLFKAGDEVVLKESGQVGIIQRCGTNFLVVEFGNWKKRVWLDQVELLENCGGVGEPKVTKKYADATPGQKVPEFKSFKDMEEGGLWTNIHKKRKRIKNGSGEKMRKKGSKGAPTDQDFKDASGDE